ncbi:hypothetical protein HY968_00760 [Candidatus Kaiserbacteria bacterium]|nr:hypothetical protein [Candidatus Kaiserbacteria bacterium]
MKWLEKFKKQPPVVRDDMSMDDLVEALGTVKSRDEAVDMFRQLSKMTFTDSDKAGEFDAAIQRQVKNIKFVLPGFKEPAKRIWTDLIGEVEANPRQALSTPGQKQIENKSE